MADVRWTGRAAALKAIKTSTLGGTWIAGETLTFTINQNSLVLTIGATAIATILDDILVMWTGSGDFSAGASSNQTGNNIPEFAEITPTENGVTKLTLTHKTAGIPFTVTKGTTSASGTVGAITVVQDATGPNDAANVANYSIGALPSAADNLFFDNSNVSVLYGLTALSAIALTRCEVDRSYTGQIGLPERNGAGYVEYRDQYLVLNVAKLIVGQGDGSGSGRIKIDSSTNQIAVEVLYTPSGLETGLGAFIWKGVHASNTLSLFAGSASIAPFGGEVSTIPTISVNGGSLSTGTALTLTTATVNGGDVLLCNALTTLNVYGGTSRLIGTGALTTLNLFMGTVNYESSGTITTANLGGFSNPALLECGGDPRAKTITTINFDANSKLNDPNRVVTLTNKNFSSHMRSVSVL